MRVASFNREGAAVYQLFVLEHDLAKAFSNATGYADMPMRLPYEKCVFEMKLGGKRVLVFLDEDPSISSSLLVRTAVGWYPLAPFRDEGELSKFSGIIDPIYAQIKAACVAMEAGVVEKVLMPSPVVRRLPVEAGGYHILKVRRTTKAYVYEAHEPTYRVALHFRHGHYNHYHVEGAECSHVWGKQDQLKRESCTLGCGAWRTWVNALLAGDPDLGFIDKEYRL